MIFDPDQQRRQNAGGLRGHGPLVGLSTIAGLQKTAFSLSLITGIFGKRMSCRLFRGGLALVACFPRSSNHAGRFFEHDMSANGMVRLWFLPRQPSALLPCSGNVANGSNASVLGRGPHPSLSALLR